MYRQAKRRLRTSPPSAWQTNFVALRLVAACPMAGTHIADIGLIVGWRLHRGMIDGKRRAVGRSGGALEVISRLLLDQNDQ
ncbi:hypothetical protein LJR234_000006 [Mesorhizobium amorphae]|uniref:hypothetical protein n=1 Tax=Mesorhizobium amorphae TaxID=71433 RepID=UPI003ECD3F31